MSIYDYFILDNTSFKQKYSYISVAYKASSEKV